MIPCKSLHSTFTVVCGCIVLLRSSVDTCRVKLAEIPGVECSDYVNASYIDVSLHSKLLYIYHEDNISL